MPRREIGCLMLLVALSCFCLGSWLVAEVAQKEIEQRVLGCSVQVAVLEGMAGALSEWRTAGSGTVFRTPKGVFILTAGHVIKNAKEEVDEHPQPEEEVSQPKKRTVFHDVTVILLKEKGGRVVSELRLYCRVIKFSPEEEEGGNDVAVLQPYDEEAREILRYGALPLPPDKAPYVGQPVYHCGSLFGELVNSVTFGVIASTGRVYRNKSFLQLSTPASPGSSGGGVFVVSEGRCYYAGMLTRGGGETINLAVPIRRLRETLAKWGMEFIFNEAQ